MTLLKYDTRAVPANTELHYPMPSQAWAIPLMSVEILL